MNSLLISAYNKLIHNHSKLSYTEFNRLHKELTILSYALYVQHKVNSMLPIDKIASIIKEEYQL